MEHIKRVGRELMYKGSMLEFIKIRLLHQTARQCIGIILSIRELRLLLLFVMMANYYGKAVS